MSRPLIVLVHSASVGPATWTPAADHLRRRGLEVSVPSMLGFAAAGPPLVDAYLRLVERALETLPGDGAIVLVGHSNAGLFLPVIAASLAPRRVSLLFADASIPDHEARHVPVAATEFIDYLRGLATDGVLPPWSGWWPDEDVSGLYPSPEVRARVTAEEPRLPLSFYEESVPVPAFWAERRCAYLRFSDGYEAEALQASGYGWPVLTLRGEHLHMLVDPAGVAGAIEELAVQLTLKR